MPGFATSLRFLISINQIYVCHVSVQIILYGLPYHIYFEGQIDIIVVVVVVKHTFYLNSLVTQVAESLKLEVNRSYTFLLLSHDITDDIT